jgi:hypothetical protein
MVERAEIDVRLYTASAGWALGILLGRSWRLVRAFAVIVSSLTWGGN